jgi:flagellar hook-basal body complex protein FliE
MGPINTSSLFNPGSLIQRGELPTAAKLNPAEQSQPSFKKFLLDSLGQVNAMQQDADHAVEQLFTGGEVNTAEVLTAVQKADMSFKMMMQVRNKLVAAYQEIKDIRI